MINFCLDFSKLTFVIPTYERAEELTKNLSFLNQKYNNCTVLIMDGSPTPSIDKNSISPFTNLRIKYVNKASPFTDRLFSSTKFIQTQYVSLLADDDRMHPLALYKSISFLDSNYDFSSCIGTSHCLLKKGTYLKHDTL